MCSTLRPVILLLLLLLAGTVTLLKGGEAAVAGGSERSRLGTFRRVIENGCNLSVFGGTDSPSVLTCRAAGFLTVHQSLDSSSLQPYISNLTKLDLTSNNATDIPAGIFRRLVNLEILLLRKNRLNRIDERAFENLSNLRVLELDDNDLSDVPAAALASLVNLEDLSISNNGITRLEEGAFASCAKLVSLDLRGNPIRKIAGGTFDNLRKLRKLILSDLKGLVEFPNLSGTESLQILRIDRASLELLPDDFCLRCPRIRSLDVKSNRLRSVPNLGGCADLRVLDLASNRITSLSGRPFADLGSLHDLLLSNNNLREIPRDAFVGLSRLQILDLENNEIGYIDPEAFREFRRLEDLNLGNNVFPDLPVEGLSGVLHLKTFNNPALREFPPADSFPRVRTMLLSYAYHCCSFVRNEADEEERRRRRRPSGSSAVTVLGGGAAAAATTSTSAGAVPIRESVLFPNDDEFDMNLWNSSFIDVWPRSHNSSGKSDSRLDELWDKFGGDFTYPGNPSYTEEEYLDEIDEQQREQDDMTQATSAGMVTSKANALPPPPPPPPPLPPSSIQCLPQPGPFLPCRDLFDWWTLRCGVWVVFLLAMLGNGTVVFVIVFSRSKMDVPRFLVCNLAAADFFMGIYLGLLAVVDASTLGEFRKYAIPWQMSVGCQLAGFLGVLSSELSVYTLAVITLERNYAITHAMHLNKRLSLRHAGYIMSIGWIFAVTMASLPLLGASDYRKFAICLPFETSGSAALGYVVFLMLINGLAFLILMGCYLKMYCAIRGSQAWNSNDSRIAKRMALLVFTDFLCWSPIAFFSLTATFGLRLVSLEQAKVFAVFVLPLNSCCNPFLYAILTKQFKKDCVLICKAIEESRVTRGIGRCRHSSNFSNRQTPANTNSLVDRSSRDNNPPPTEEGNHFEGGGCGCNAKLVRSGNPVTTTTTTAAAAAAATTTAATTTTSRRSAQRRNECGCADDNDDDGDDDDDDDVDDNDDDDDDVEDDGGDEEEAEMEEVANAEKRCNNRAIAKTIVWWESLGCPCSSGGGGIGRNGDGGNAQPRRERRERDDRYAYRIAEIQQKQRKRASSSVSSSDNFSSSRSDSWRRHHCGIPLRPVEPAAKRRAASSWLVTRKPSQDSNLSSSRNDSSGSATTASTSTWRISRSSASIDAATATAIARTAVQPRPAAAVRPKPRLTRQLAIRDELTEPPGSGGVAAAAAAATASSCCSPSRLAAVRLLATIPSATEMSEQRDDETACSSSAVLRQ